MQQQDPILDDEYASEEDSDFAPDAAPADAASDQSDSDAGPDDDNAGSQTPAEAQGKPAKPRRDDDDQDGYENSGDEAIIEKGKKRQKKAKRQDGGDGDDDDEGGEGGLVKTRRMRALEKVERRAHVPSGPVTVDVDDLWAKMMAAPVMPNKTAPATAAAAAGDQSGQQPGNVDVDGKATKENDAAAPQDRGAKTGAPNEPAAMIKIKRTYNFAGKVHTEEKLVPRESAEAKLYLASLDPDSAEAAAADPEGALERRRPRKAFRSAFEPMVALAGAGEGGGGGGVGRRDDLDLGVAARLRAREQARAAKKLNVVEKSRMDWAGFVDKAGIQDELELAGKSKESFAGRQDFLARVEANREEDARRARAAGRA